MDDKPRNSILQRRAFLRRATVVGAGLLATSLAACAQPAASPTAAPQKPAATAVPAKPTAGAATKPAAPTAAATQAPPKPQTLQKARIAVITGVAEYAFAMAGTDLYKEEGIDPEFVEIVDGGTMIKALLAGEIDHAMLGSSALYISQSQGAPLKQVGATFPGLSFVMYAKPGITSLQELEGKSIGTAAPGSFLNIVATATLMKNNIPVDKVNFVNIGASPAVFQAVQTGKVDAGPSSIDFIPQAERDKNPVIIAELWKELPDYLRVGSATHEKIIADKPQFMQAIVNGITRTIRFNMDNKANFVQYGVEKMGKDKSAMEFLHDYNLKNRINAPDHQVEERWDQFTQQLNVDAGSQPALMPFEKTTDLRFQKAFVEKYGKYQYKS